jgi:methyl-accepting chemotaxis protein
MDHSKEKVKVGSDTANNCNQALEEILTNVSTVDTLVAEIAVASQEQATGIREIAKAVGQMEQVTQQNSSVAETSSSSAEDLNKQSQQLIGVVEQLTAIVNGNSDTNLNIAQNWTEKVTKKTTTEKKAKVIKLVQAQKESQESSLKNDTYVEAKKVANSDVVPSSDNPGFEE